MDETTLYVIVGAVPGQPLSVVSEAATFAQMFDADLVCASVDASRYTVDRLADGTVVSMPIDPDSLDEEVLEFDPQLHATIAAVLDQRNVTWTVRALAGAPAAELAHLADELNAAMIVVGTRETGLRESLREFFNGSVAVHLAHRQHRPVVVIPLNPIGTETALPWAEDDEMTSPDSATTPAGASADRPDSRGSHHRPQRRNA